jgi:hypothetical protein
MQRDRDGSLYYFDFTIDIQERQRCFMQVTAN